MADRQVALVALAAALCACAGGGAPAVSPANQINGSVHGQELVMVAAVAGSAQEQASPPDTFTQYSILLTTDQAYACGQQFVTRPRSARSLALGLTTVAQKAFGLPAGPGDYLVTQAPGTDGNYAIVSYSETDAQCGAVKSAHTLGSTGTVHLGKIGGAASGEASGSFDLILDSGDRLTGTFDTTACATSASDAGTCL